ncbi:hypothetical protein [Teichococcus vastitatis]|uniref:DUF58 domain-containing protein n=1 Tax=Teichococcus vastitatis TaxID=2307076 RepID=A0ABS9W645_9PROT|nr:hypothetical protein [Pseudoroseomonas vastitatis]MCI0754756.1 hypothetical protein [Pseudoroseomonas vastitatis]
MPRFPFSRLPAVAVMASAGLGVHLGAFPELSTPSGWAVMALLGAAGSTWALWRRAARRPPALSLTLRPLPDPQTLDDVLHFISAAPLAWCARRGEWCLEIDASGPADLPWRLEVRHAQWREPSLSLARAASFDAALTASRRLYATRESADAGTDLALREAARLLGCDMEFSLPGLQQRITALAEGGYALHDETGCRALSPPTVDALLDEAGRLHNAAG